MVLLLVLILDPAAKAPRPKTSRPRVGKRREAIIGEEARGERDKQGAARIGSEGGKAIISGEFNRCCLTGALVTGTISFHVLTDAYLWSGSSVGRAAD